MRRQRKQLRVYIEYPAQLPGQVVGQPRQAGIERAVVVSTAFGASLPPMRLLAIHDCHYVEAASANPHLVLAQVAGFDRAAYGLDDVRAHPLLFEHRDGRLLVCTTKLSQFVTARYATQEALRASLAHGIRLARAGLRTAWNSHGPRLCGRPMAARTRCRPTPPGERSCAGLTGTPTLAVDARVVASAVPGHAQTGAIDAGNPVGPPIPSTWPAGDGTLGVLEGVASRISYDGSQKVRWWLRSDSVGETALAFALRWKLERDERSRRIAANLLDWVYFRSGLFVDDAGRGSGGLLRWAWDNDACYGDNCIKVILSAIGVAALLGDERWDDRLVKTHPGQLPHDRRSRLPPELDPRAATWTGSAGRPIGTGRRRSMRRTTRRGFGARTYGSTTRPTSRSCSSARGAPSSMMMAAYPHDWRWTNGIQQERGRMLLTLAWLVRVDDQPQHRAWLRQIAEDMASCQDASGAIREELGELAKGSYRPPLSNAEYGSNEAALIQENGDPVADLLYTCNFAFLGLHEAHAATGEPLYRDMADRLAAFLVRVQVQSETHPELDGGWFRAFDYRQWEYWGSNADAAGAPGPSKSAGRRAGSRPCWRCVSWGLTCGT